MRYIFIDCGSHLGESIKAFQETDEYLEHQWEIYSFEANPFLNHLSLLEKPYEINFFLKAVWVKDGTIPLYLDEKTSSEGSTLYREKNTGKINRDHPVIVQCFDLSRWILEKFQKDDYLILKLDVEGAEYKVLEKMIQDTSIEYVDRLYVEFHAEKINYEKEKEKILIDQLRKYPMDIVTEKQLMNTHTKENLTAVDAIWFLGEKRIVSARNTQRIKIIERQLQKNTEKLEKIENRLIYETNRLNQKDKKIDNDRRRNLDFLKNRIKIIEDKNKLN